MKPSGNGRWRIHLLTATLATAAAALYFLRVEALPVRYGSFNVPWWAIAIAAFLAEANVVHVHFRKDAESFSLSELPLVVGLFFTSPAGLMAAQLIGPAAALILRRKQPPTKLAFNVSLIAATTAVSIVVFRLIARPGSPISVTEGAAGLIAGLAFSLVGVLMVLTAIRLVEGSFPSHRARLVLGLGAGMSFTNASLGILTVAAIRIDPKVAVLWAVPAIALYFAYRAYIGERQQHEHIGGLYDSTRALQRTLRVEATAEEVLRQARTMFRAETASLALFSDAQAEPATFTLGLDEELSVSSTATLDPTQGVWARAVSDGEPVLVPRPIRNERLRVHFEAQGIRDAVVVPLFVEERVAGTLLIANRLGDVATFGQEDVTLLKTLANHAASALENARLVSELQNALERQTELNRLKDEFVATVSHELRTPLTSIQGFVKTLTRPDMAYSQEEQRSFLEIVERQSERLRTLIEDLLLVSRIEQHQIRPAPAPVNVDTTLQHLAQGFALRASDHRLSVQVAQPLPALQSDEEGINRIVSNLIENAIKYSPAGTAVSLEASSSEGGVLITVRDEGIGIPQAAQEHIFERFFQVDQTNTRQTGGAGLGLYICARLAQEIGARLWLERSAPGAGSTFCLWLPPRPGNGASDGDGPQAPALRSVG